jgi:triosephosphate isomerase (TIM)
MSRRKPLICANWKMHSPPKGWDAPDSPYRPEAGVDVVVFPSFLALPAAITAKLIVGGQCGRSEPEGAFTGDVSMKMLKDIGCTHVLCGHSERRKYHKETDAFIAEQVAAALEVGLHPILCIGETKEQRDRGHAQQTVKKQLTQFSIFNFQFSIAYEPVWAIGSGMNALPDDAEKMHAFIRSLLPKESRESTRIIYGGSVNDLNAADFLAHPDIDGLLVGGASLLPEQFRGIVETGIAA